MFTNTHLILLQVFCGQQPGPGCWVVQAFTVPDDYRPVDNGKGELRLSHEGILSGGKEVFNVIRNSVVDPTTGDISVKILERYVHAHDFPHTCIDLTLHKPSQDDVSPITIDRHSVLIEGDAPTPGDSWKLCRDCYDIDISDGYARGWFTQDHSCPPVESFDAVKFTIDATQDRCVAVLSKFSGLEWNTIVLPILRSSPEKANVVLDSVRGKLSYVDKDYGRRVIVVVDIE